MSAAIGPRAFNLIVTEEVGSEAEYERADSHTTWPGGVSGVTVGIGFDLGYTSVYDIRAAWAGLIPDAMVATLCRCAGIHGGPARELAEELRDSVMIPWSAAITEFTKREVPKWIGITIKALPNTDKLPPDCLGVLVSLTYNRGPSYAEAGDRYREMRALKAHMAEGDFQAIPGDITAMRRLWPEGGDLWRRRGHEAALFASALSAPQMPASVPSTAPVSVPIPPSANAQAPAPQAPPPAPAPVSETLFAKVAAFLERPAF